MRDMNLSIHRHSGKYPTVQRALSALALGIATTLLLTACGGGGDRIVRADPPPAAPPPPPPVVGPCQSSSADCILMPTADSSYQVLSGGRDTSGRLLVEGANARFETGTYSFASGAEILAGDLMVLAGANLASNTVVRSGSLRIFGSATGNVENFSTFRLDGGQLRGDLRNAGEGYLFTGTITGEVLNQGRFFANQDCYPYADECSPLASSRIDGNFTQTAEGSLWLTLGMPLQVTGTAGLDGTLHVVAQRFRLDAPYVLPGAGSSQHLLHAAGGISGTFDQWQSSGSTGPGNGIFLEGALRYTGTDLYFDVTRASLQATMASASIGGASSLTSAGNLDNAFSAADGFSQLPQASLTPTQRRFLASAASIQHIDNYAQAVASLDSLSGQQQADSVHELLQQMALPSLVSSERLDRMHPGLVAGTWSAAGNEAGISGFDKWLSPRLLVGTQVDRQSIHPSSSDATHRNQPFHGSAYLRYYRDDGWYAGGELGIARNNFELNRILDLGPAGRWNAHSQRQVDIVNLRSEVGRSFNVGHGLLTPFAAFVAVGLQGDGFVEQGQTGMELSIQPTQQALLSSGIGVRFGQGWRIGNGNWLRLDASVGYQHSLAQGGGPLRAAFIGVSETWFDLGEATNSNAGWYSIALRGGHREWKWSLDHGQQSGNNSYNGPTWLLSLQRPF